MNVFICALLLLGLAPSACPERRIHIVYVEPPGQTLTIEHQAAVQAGIEQAIAFWQDLAPLETTLTLADSYLITTTAPLTGSLEWSRPYFADPTDLTLFVIDSPGPLVGDAVAQSQAPLGIIWALRGDGPGWGATIAHELGHVLYDLPHQYQDAEDIMGLVPLAAYERHMIGCSSLAQLGRPCQHLALPLITH